MNQTPSIGCILVGYVKSLGQKGLRFQSLSLPLDSRHCLLCLVPLQTFVGFVCYIIV